MEQEPQPTKTTDSRSLAEVIKDYLPLITGCLVLIGFYDIYFFYNQFGVDIYNFIDVSEILFAFSSLYIYLIVGLVCVCGLYFSVFAFYIPISKTKSITSRLEKASALDIRMKSSRFAKYARRISGVVLLLFPIGFILYTISSFQHVRNSEVAGLFIAIFLGLVLSIDEFGVKVEGTMLLWILCFLFLSFVTYRGFVKYQNIVHGYSDQVVSMDLPNGNFTSSDQGDDGIHFIGSTRTCFFFWMIREKTVKIVPIGDAREISIRQAAKLNK
jgi:hypothetical protein